LAGRGGFSGILKDRCSGQAGLVAEKETCLRGQHLLATSRWPFATLAARSTLAIPTCPRGRRGQGTMLNHRVGRRVSVSQEDQFQRNGVILDRRSGVWNDDTGAVSRGGAGRLYWHL
jgi:hypothetical protein